MTTGSQTQGSGVGRAGCRDDRPVNGVKVFSATVVGEREQLGEKVTQWLKKNPKIEVRDAFVTQSSDESFHCVAITLFYWEDLL